MIRKEALLSDCNYNCHCCGENFAAIVDWQKHIIDYFAYKGCYPYTDESIREHNRSVLGSIAVTREGFHSCSFCKKVIKEKNDLVLHIFESHLSRPSRCAVCSETFAFDQSLKRHMSRHKPKPSYFKCWLCNYKTWDSRDMRNHEKTEHPEGYRTRCKRCKRLFVSEDALQQHISTVNNSESISCTICGKKCCSYEMMEWHMVDHGDRRAFACNLCSFSTPKLHNLSRHLKRRHASNSSVKCCCCGLGLPSESALKIHFLECHSINWVYGNQFKCTICKFKTRYEYCVRRHEMDNHTDQGDNIKCDECAWYFPSRVSYKNHLSKEHGEKPNRFNCSFCPFSTALAQRLYGHISQMHKDNVRYLCCQHCTYKTTVKRRLKSHVFCYHTPGRKTYQCDACKLTYYRKNSLIRHIQKFHVALESYRCGSCHLLFASLSSMFMHNNIIHLSRNEFLCNACKFIGKNRNSFIKHVLHYHTVKYFCHDCPYTAAMKYQIATHIRVKHTPLVLLHCKECKYTTKQRYLLYRHINVNHNPKAIVYTCYHCGHTNKIKHKLSQHMQTKHRDLLKKKKQKNTNK